jgi:hypothetical protein
MGFETFADAKRQNRLGIFSAENLESAARGGPENRAEFETTKLKFVNDSNILITGGRSGIRTHGGVAPTAVFKTAALNHSAILPE